MKIYTYLLLTLLTFAFTSCDDTEAGGTSVEEMAGDWWVTSTPDGGSASAYFLINTYNTAANVPTEMWIESSDDPNGAIFKVKVAVDYDNRAFMTSDFVDNLFASEGGPARVKIQDGKITENAYTAPSQSVVDKITFKVVLEDGTTYTIDGYYRTGFAEDDH